MGGKARQEMRGGECKGGRTDERAEPLNIHAAEMNRTDSPEYSTVYGDDKNYSAPGKNRISELSRYFLDTAAISRWADKP